jgi:subfamily B ATP-binding cassette protein MsbA
MGAYTPLNSLKQCAALADQCLDRVIQVVNEIPNLHSPLNIQDATEFACDQLTQLRAMINDSCAAHAGEVAETYSDDRPVMSVVPYGESGDLFTYVWDADPDGPGNQPGTLPIPPILADDFGYRFVVVAPGIIEAVETPPSDKSHIAAAAGIATVAIAVVSGAAFYVASYSTEKLGQSIGNDLRVRLYHHLQELSLAFYDHNRVGTILSTLTTDVQTIQSFLSTSTLNIFTDALTLVAMIVVMFWLRRDFALIALAVTPLLIIFLVRVNKAIKTAVKDVRTRQSDLLSTLQEGLQSIEVVQAYSREDYEDRQVRRVSMDTVTAWLRTRRLSAMLSPVVSLVIAVCTGLVLWRGALLILAGTMTAGALTVFLAYLARFFQPVRALSQMTNTLAQVSVGFQRVTAVCDADSVIPERPAPVEPPPFKGEITFQNVSFGYDPEVPVLRDVSFTIAPGQLVGIVGPTGSGKSTLVSLIPRFRDLHGGRITIDGRHRRLRTTRTPHPDRVRAAEHGAVAGNHPRQHRFRPARCH